MYQHKGVSTVGKTPSFSAILSSLNLSFHLDITNHNKLCALCMTLNNISNKMETDQQTEELEESVLGTVDYWEKCYKDEMKQFNRFGDPGEIWFGHDIVKRLLRWMNSSDVIKKDAEVVDLGCGNGMLLVELANEGFSNLTGLDYSENAILLCKKVTDKHKFHITFKVCDILNGLGSTYDIILDKGTYDAVSLSKDAKANRTKYIQNVNLGLRTNGVFIIVSCNWTENELIEHFKLNFTLIQTIPTPQFTFGGTVGNVVTICSFKKI